MNRRLGFSIPLLVIVGMLVVCSAGTSHAIDDGWRRTAQGWERMLDPSARMQTTDEPRLSRIHPIVLACWQAAAGIGGLMMGEGTIRRRIAPAPAI